MRFLSTYFGGNARDVVRDVAVDAAGTIHIVGTTGSTTLPLVQPVQPTLASANDAFIARFGPTGGALTFSSFLGSTQVNEEGMTVAATATGQTVAGGWTAGNNFPRVNPYQNLFQGGFTDAWVARLGPGADSSASSECDRTTAEPGSQIIYTMSVSNSGPDAVDERPRHRHPAVLAHAAVVRGDLGRRLLEHRQRGERGVRHAAAQQLGDDHHRREGEPAGDPGQAIANGVSLQTDSADPNPANNSSTNTVTVVAAPPDGDTDTDGLPNGWESEYGLDPLTGDAGADPDGDGRTNLQEYQQGTHPRGFVITYFAEGATGSFFDTVIAVTELDRHPRPGPQPLPARGWRGDSQVSGREAHSRATIVVEQIPGMASAAFSTLIEADVPVVADRTMSWDSTGYGGHAERGTLTRATSTWYLAEGATHGSFGNLSLPLSRTPATLPPRWK